MSTGGWVYIQGSFCIQGVLRPGDSASKVGWSASKRGRHPRRVCFYTCLWFCSQGVSTPLHAGIHTPLDRHLLVRHPLVRYPVGIHSPRRHYGIQSMSVVNTCHWGSLIFRSDPSITLNNLLISLNFSTRKSSIAGWKRHCSFTSGKCNFLWRKSMIQNFLHSRACEQLSFISLFVCFTGFGFLGNDWHWWKAI